MEREQVTFDTVRGEARRLSELSYEPQRESLPEKFRAMGYDDYRKILFKREQALWNSEPIPFQVQFFHRGYLFQDPVYIFEFTDTHVQELPYVKDFFQFGDLNIQEFPRRGSGYAGWRLLSPLNSTDRYDEVIAFLGASYFRALGQGQDYGLSARALYLPHAMDEQEEFPEFVKFWLKKPAPDENEVLVYGLLDSQSITGAYQFRIEPGSPTVVHVLAALYPREHLQEIGLGGLTSMFYFGENSQPKPDDFRPEVHDSDGLALRYYGNNYLWRPLEARQKEQQSRFPGENLRSFGLYQRDREYHHYLDSEARYQRRPSARMSLGTGFSGGEILLREMPPNKEFHDNIVAAFIPDEPLVPGNVYQYEYSLEWGSFGLPEEIASVVATRHGQDLNDPQIEIFLIEFNLPEGIDARELSADFTLPQEVSIEDHRLEIDAKARLIRVYFQLIPGGKKSIKLSVSLKAGEKTVSETWVYQWDHYN